VAEGTKLVNEILHSEFEVTSIYATPKWLKEHRESASFANESVSAEKDELSRISSLVTASDVLAVVRIPERELVNEELREGLVLVLDGVRDPGNMGTIIRIADWFGIDHVICSDDCAEIWNPKVVQASMGSLLRVKIHEKNLPKFFSDDAFRKMKIPVYGTFMSGESVYETQPAKNGMIVIGNEANGIEEAVEPFITNRITIPAVAHPGKKTGGAESLNAAIATAIVVAEFRRKA
jgi:TrmH family RNA methyltransferase